MQKSVNKKFPWDTLAIPVRIKYVLPPKFHFYKLTLWIYVNMHTKDYVCTMIFIVFIREMLKIYFSFKRTSEINHSMFLH